MREGWQLKSLGAVADFKGGGTPSTEMPDYWNGEIPWVSPKDMKTDQIGSSIDRITLEAVKNSAASIIPTGSILIVVRSGILARTIPTAITTRELTVNQDIKALCPHSGLDGNYLHYFLRSAEKHILSLVTTGATVHRLMTESIKSLQLPLPPLPEQKRIVAILDEAFEGINTAVTSAEKNLANACELFDSYLASVFAENGHRWTEQKLGEICEFEGGSQPPKSEFVYVQTEGHARFLQIRDFASDKNITYIPVSKKNRVCKDTDILIGRYGASVGKILTGKSGAYNVAIIKTIPNSRVISRSWFYNYLISSLFQSNLSKVASRSAQAGFSKDDIYNFPVPVPSLPDQVILTAKIQAISSESYRLRSIYRRKVEHLTELRQTLLERAFAGDLTVGSKDPLREAAE